MTQAVNPRRLEELLNYCSDFARDMLTRCGEFYPFGAMLQDGAVVAVGGYTGQEHPAGAEVYKLLAAGFQRDFAAGKIEAAALAANVNIPKEFSPPFPDGIRVLLECRGYSRMVYLPYAVRGPGWLGRILRRRWTLTLGEMIPVEVKPSLLKAPEAI